MNPICSGCRTRFGDYGWYCGNALRLVPRLCHRFRLSYHRHADRLPCVAAWHSGRLYRPTGPCFSDMGYDLKTGYILRGNGKDKELELFRRKQQWYAELLGFAVAFIMMAFFANNYFGQEMFAPVSKTYVSTIAAGTTPEIAKWLLIWAVPGAIIQWVFGHRQVGILFATGILVGNTLNGLTILLALLLRYILEKRNDENRQVLTILGAGALAGSALYSFFTATLGLAKKK